MTAGSVEKCIGNFSVRKRICKRFYTVHFMCVAAPDECLFLKIKTGGLLRNSERRMLFKKDLSSPCDLRGGCAPEQGGIAVQGVRTIRGDGAGGGTDRRAPRRAAENRRLIYNFLLRPR